MSYILLIFIFFFCIFLTDFRKGTLLLNNSFAVIAAVLLSLGEMSRSFEMLIIGRLIMGVDSGKKYAFIISNSSEDVEHSI